MLITNEKQCFNIFMVANSDTQSKVKKQGKAKHEDKEQDTG